MYRIILFFVIFFFALSPFLPARGATMIEDPKEIESQIAEKRAEVERLEKEIAQYRDDITKKRGEEKTLTSAVVLLQARIRKLRASIQALRATLETIQLEIRKAKRSITTTEQSIEDRKAVLAEYLRLLDRYEEKRTALLFLFNTPRFADVIDTLRDVFLLEQKVKQHVDALADLKEELAEEKAQLEEKEEEQSQILAAREAERQETARKEEEKAVLLAKTRKEAKRLKGLIEFSKETIESLKNDMYALGKLGIAVSDALSIGKLVASRVNVRAPFLIAVLEVESRLGLNVGRGNWNDDMNPNQRDTFLQITKQLGMDPNTTPVSKKPSYGWGGAMGPAQFLPKTWLGYADDVARLTGHNPPSPWNIEDAFMAAGLKLSNDGARERTRDGEMRAAKTYLSGNPRCTKQICNYYTNLVLDKADEIEEKLTQ